MRLTREHWLMSWRCFVWRYYGWDFHLTWVLIFRAWCKHEKMQRKSWEIRFSLILNICHRIKFKCETKYGERKTNKQTIKSSLNKGSTDILNQRNWTYTLRYGNAVGQSNLVSNNKIVNHLLRSKVTNSLLWIRTPKEL